MENCKCGAYQRQWERERVRDYSGSSYHHIPRGNEYILIYLTATRRLPSGRSSLEVEAEAHGVFLSNSINRSHLFHLTRKITRKMMNVCGIADFSDNNCSWYERTRFGLVVVKLHYAHVCEWLDRASESEIVLNNTFSHRVTNHLGQLQLHGI